MSTNHGLLNRDLIGGSLTIRGREVIDKFTNLHVGNIQGKVVNVKQILNETDAITMNLRVPSQYATLSDAMTVVFSDDAQFVRFRIILETEGPHVLPASHWSSNKIEQITIESETVTDHMGMYYGHNTGAYSRLGVKQFEDETVSGVGPFSVVLSSGNTVITVTGNDVDYPLGFGNGVVKAPGWIFGAPPGVFVGITPVFDASASSLLVGDQIKWFDSNTDVVTTHTITAINSNTITVNPAIPTSVVKGSGFSVVPRAKIMLGLAPLLPEIAFPGSLILNGLNFESQSPYPFIPTLTLTQVNAIVNHCLIHSQIIVAAGGKCTSLVPNTYMDTSSGTNSAKLWVNSAATTYGFRQTFVGPSAGFYGRGGGKNTMCFSLYIKNNIGISLTDNTSTKADGLELYRCATGVSLNAGSSIQQMIWAEGCGTGIKCRNNSTVYNSNIIDYGPLPVFPLVLDGQGSGVGLDFDYNCQLSTSRIRFRDLTDHAVIDGNTVVVGTVVSTSTLLSNNGTNVYGTHMSGIVFTDSDVSV